MKLGVPGEDFIAGKFSVSMIVPLKNDFPHSPGALQRFDVYVEVGAGVFSKTDSAHTRLYMVFGRYEPEESRFYLSAVIYLKCEAERLPQGESLLVHRPRFVSDNHSRQSEFTPMSASGAEATLIARAIQQSGASRDAYLAEHDASSGPPADESLPRNCD